MSGGGGEPPPPSGDKGGEFLLSLLRGPHHQQQPQLQPSAPTHSPPPPQQSPTLDPAVAAVGPTIQFVPPWPSNDLDPRKSPWPQSVPSPYPSSFYGFPQNPFPPHRVPGNHFLHNPAPMGNHGVFGDDIRRLGCPGGKKIDSFAQRPKQQEHKLNFGSFQNDVQSPNNLSNDTSILNSKFNSSMEREVGFGRSHNGFDTSRQWEPKGNLKPVRHANHDHLEQERRGGGGGKNHHGGNYRSMPSPEMGRPPPGFPNKLKGRADWEYGDRRKSSCHKEDIGRANSGELSDRNSILNREKGTVRTLSREESNVRGIGSRDMGLFEQLDHPVANSGSNLHSVSASDAPVSMEDGKEGYTDYDRDGGEVDDLGEKLVDSLLLEDESEDKRTTRLPRSSREKDSRSDSRGQHLLSQRMRMFRRQLICRSDIDRLNGPFIAIYESLIPVEEEKAKQKQLLAVLEKLVNKEWPKARLFLYGSCANSFGVCKSDIDVCLAIEDVHMDKSEILLKLADILESDNLQNVQALTRARVPIVKLMDPVTGISCDICINNVLAVINTKLLRDYAQIDARLRQLAFIIKHWAKSRGVNETYQGTLSSYAYVLMCIHFLQHRRPAILPCLQEMETTYSATVDDIHCAYFDQVEKLRHFGYNNKETIAQLVWSFFNYWAYRHDYANDVISVRTGSIISKREKNWTKRIGNDRHLICIEDPFETSHDLGRVVDKHSIKVLREEFERAADIMQNDLNPCARLFEPYVPI